VGCGDAFAPDFELEPVPDRVAPPRAGTDDFERWFG